MKPYQAIAFGISIFISLLFLPHQVLAAKQTTFVANSQRGDFVGGGLRYAYTDADAAFTAVAAPDGSFVAVTVKPRDGTGSWSIDIASPTFQPLTPGIYED